MPTFRNLAAHANRNQSQFPEGSHHPWTSKHMASFNILCSTSPKLAKGQSALAGKSGARAKVLRAEASDFLDFWQPFYQEKG